MPAGQQITFASGEVAPALWGRVDLARYATGLRRLLNFIIHPQGGASNRAGTEFVTLTRLTGKARLIPFEYNTEQAYVLEFGPSSLRIIKREGDVSGIVLEPAFTVTGVTNANPGVVTTALAHGFSPGDYVQLFDIGGMPRLHTAGVIVGAVTAFTFQMSTFGGPFDISDAAVWGVFTAGGTVARMKTVATAYLEAELPRLNYTQSADVMRVVHPLHVPREATRGGAGHYDFTIGDMVMAPVAVAPTALKGVQDYGIKINSIQIAKTVGGNETRLIVMPKRNILRDGDRIRITGLTTVTELNEKYFVISRTDPGGNTSDVNIVNTNGSLIDETGFAAAVGTYAETGIIATEEVIRYRVTAHFEGEESLASTEIALRNTTNPQATAPIIVAWTPPLVSGVPDTRVKRYSVYADKTDNGLFGFIGERNVETRTPIAISGATVAPVCVVTTATSHGLSKGDIIYIYGVAGMTQLNDRNWKVRNVLSATTLELSFLSEAAADSTTWGAYVGGATDFLVVSDFYFSDVGIAPELTDPAPPQTANNPFNGAGKYPAAVAFHEQRGVFGGTTENIQSVWLTQPGNIYNFNQSEPSTADDAIEFSLPGRKANAVRHLVSQRDLFIFTGGAEYQSSSGDAGYLIDNLRNTEISDNGVAEYPAPLAILNTVLYVQARGNSIWDMGYQFESNGYKGEDRTLPSAHIFEGRTIVDWAYAHVPDRIVWVVLDDGTFASLTYVPEQGVWGWARHETQGDVEAVCAISEGSETGVYLIVKRFGLRFIERMRRRSFEDPRDFFGLDCGLSYDVPVAITAATHANPVVVTAAGHGLVNGDTADISDVEGMDALNTEDGGQYRVGHVSGNDVWLMRKYFDPAEQTAIAGITNANPAVVTSTAHGRANGEIVQLSGALGMTEVNAKFYRVAGATANTFQLQTLAGANVNSTAYGVWTMDGVIDLAQTLDGTELDSEGDPIFGTYTEGGYIRKAITLVRGLNHLTGRTVKVVANGALHPDLVVNAYGEITLERAASRIHAGLGYTSELETLDINEPSGTLAGTLRAVKRVVVRLWKTRSLKVGPSVGTLNPIKLRDGEGYNELTQLAEGEYPIEIEPEWNRNGRILLRQDEPMPVTVLGVAAKFAVGENR